MNTRNVVIVTISADLFRRVRDANKKWKFSVGDDDDFVTHDDGSVSIKLPRKLYRGVCEVGRGDFAAGLTTCLNTSDGLYTIRRGK